MTYERAWLGGKAMNQPKKILLIKLGSIGDVVNTLPFVNALKRGWPETELAWLIEPKSYPIVEGHRSVDRFFVFQRDKKWSGVKEALAEIRAFRPDLVIDLQRILRSSFFTYFSRCPRRLGFDRGRSKEGSWLFTNRKVSPSDPGRHMVLQYLEFADYLGLSPSEIEFDIPLSEADRRGAEGLLPPAFLQSGFIALNLGAAKPANRWPPARWIELAELIARGSPYSVVLTGGPQDEQAGEECRKGAALGDRLIDLTGRTALKGLAAVFSRAEAVVSGDTGPLHIASALGRMTIGLFGPADPRRTGPFNYLDLVVTSGVDCRPCGKRNCIPNRCLEEITAARVFESLSRAIEDARKAAE